MRQTNHTTQKRYYLLDVIQDIATQDILLSTLSDYHFEKPVQQWMRRKLIK